MIDGEALAAPVREGDVLAGKYCVQKVLGVGGMGVVVAATHLQLGQRVALKFLTIEPASNPQAVERFLREARAAVRIQSEHVARVIDVGTLDGGGPYMVMEYLVGADLSQALAARPHPAVSDAIDWLLQACEAIAEAHAHGIVHRDLKPANLFMTHRADGSILIKVLDFGISKTTSLEAGMQQASMTATTTVMGSPLYMSPEQMRSAKYVDVRTDIWALGAVLFELLAGRPVFQAETLPGLCAMIATEPPPPLRAIRPDVPEAVERVVSWCLEKEPSKRPRTVAALAGALARHGSEEARVSAARIARVLNANPTTTEVLVGVGPAAHSETAANWGATTPGPRTRGPIIGVLVLSALGVLGAGGVGLWWLFARGSDDPIALAEAPAAAVSPELVPTALESAPPVPVTSASAVIADASAAIVVASAPPVPTSPSKGPRGGRPRSTEPLVQPPPTSEPPSKEPDVDPLGDRR